MTQQEKAYSYLEQYHSEMISLWEEFVRLESPSAVPEAIDEVARHLDTYCRALGMATDKFKVDGSGTCVEAETASRALSPIMFLGHIDTVHPIGSFPGGPWSIREDGWVYGPGVHDCKGGMIIALYVIRALQHAGYDKRQLKLLVVGDEEVGHATSKMESVNFLRKHAEGCGAVFTFESGSMNGDIVTRRKGGGNIKLTVDGIASHCGLAPKDGASAIREAARKIVAIEDITDYDNILFNCGKISGGTAVNTIPANCSVDICIRFQTNKDKDDGIAALHEICGKVETPNTKCTVGPMMGFPAMEETEKTGELVALYQDACESLGLDRPATLHVAGCSDSAYTTSMGIPTLSGGGVRGVGNHSINEHADPASLLTQAKKLVATILAMPDSF